MKCPDCESTLSRCRDRCRFWFSVGAVFGLARRLGFAQNDGIDVPMFDNRERVFP